MVKLLAHRGGVGGTDITENTLKAFQRAFHMESASGIECDLRKVQSGEIVIHHDAKTTTTQQFLKNLSLTELLTICPEVCTLYDLLRLAATSSYQGILNLEIKEYNVARDLCNTILKFPQLNIFITSFLHPEVEDSYEYLQQRLQPKDYLEMTRISFGLIYRSFPLTFSDTLHNTPYKMILSNHVIPFHRK